VHHSKLKASKTDLQSSEINYAKDEEDLNPLSAEEGTLILLKLN